MNATKALLLPALLLPLPLLLASNAPGTRLRFAPSEGASLTKTFEVKTDLSLDDMSMGGAAAGMQPDMEMTMAVTYKVVVSDEYVKLGEARPAKLKRTYDELGSEVSTSMKMEMMGQSRDSDSSMSAESELAGKSVMFTWDAEKEAYKKAFDPEGGEEKLLEGLREDMDLRALLPAGEVAEGDEWEVPPSKLASVLAPGGDMSLKPKDMPEDAMGMSSSGMENLADLLGEDVEGKITAKFTGLREVDGTSLAVVQIRIDVKSKTDMTDKVREAVSKGDLPPEVEGFEFDHIDVEYSVECEGELLWDVAAGHFRSLDLSGTTGFKSEQAMSVSVQGRKMDIEQSMELSGTTSFRASAQ